MIRLSALISSLSPESFRRSSAHCRKVTHVAPHEPEDSSPERKDFT
jgi:hypothetical protein